MTKIIFRTAMHLLLFSLFATIFSGNAFSEETGEAKLNLSRDHCYWQYSTLTLGGVTASGEHNPPLTTHKDYEIKASCPNSDLLVHGTCKYTDNFGHDNARIGVTYYGNSAVVATISNQEYAVCQFRAGASSIEWVQEIASAFCCPTN